MGAKIMKILVTYPIGTERDSFIPSEVIRKLDSMYEVVWNYSIEQFSEDELKEKIRDVDVCIVGWSCRRLDKIYAHVTLLKQKAEKEPKNPRYLARLTFFISVGN